MSQSHTCTTAYLILTLGFDTGDARLARNARPLTVGTLRPNIVLYDEAHPLGDEIGDITTRDMARKPDMLIIMGTSLKVHGIKKLVKNFANAVHATAVSAPTPDDAQSTLPSPSPSPSKKPTKSNPTLWTVKNPKLVVFVNRTPPPADLASMIDVWVEGETDAWVTKCEADWRHARPQDWQVQATLFGLQEKDTALGEESNTWKVVKAGMSASALSGVKPKREY